MNEEPYDSEDLITSKSHFNVCLKKIFYTNRETEITIRYLSQYFKPK